MEPTNINAGSSELLDGTWDMWHISSPFVESLGLTICYKDHQGKCKNSSKLPYWRSFCGFDFLFEKDKCLID